MPSQPFLDEINLGIVRHLWNGRKPYAEIAKDLGITTTTVRRRVNRLVKAGILQIIGLVDPKAVAGLTAAPGEARADDKVIRILGTVSQSGAAGNIGPAWFPGPGPYPETQS